MKIIITPDPYRESLSATEVAQVTEKGFRKIFPDVQYVSVLVTDGGERTVEAIIAATQGSEHSAQVTGPLGEKVNTYWSMSEDGKTAFVEMAAANDLALVPPEKYSPLVTTSRGTGELILQAPDNGVQSITIGIDGSATNDGGVGMVQVLGAKLCDANGTEIGYDGGSLMSLGSIDAPNPDPRLKTCSTRVACDATNPLTGDSGVPRISGPQKGTMEEYIFELDRNLPYYVDIIKKLLRVDVKSVPGLGAAGGMSATLMAFLGTELRSSIEIVTQALNLERHIHDCTLVMTGEGRIDSQSIHSKVPVGIANVMKKYHKPVVGIGDSLTHDVEIVHQYGIGAVFGASTSISALEEVLRGAFNNTYHASRDVAATLVIGMYSTR